MQLRSSIFQWLRQWRNQTYHRHWYQWRQGVSINANHLSGSSETEGKPLTHRSSGRRMFIEDVLFHVVDLNLHFRVRFPNIMFWQSQQTSWQVFTIHYVIYTSNISKLNVYQWTDIIFCTFIFPAAWDPALQCCLQVNVTFSTGGSPVGGWA